MMLPEGAVLWADRSGPPDTLFVRVFYENDSYKNPVLTCDVDWSARSKDPIIALLPLKEMKLVGAGYAKVPAPILNEWIEPNTRKVSI